MLNFLKKKNIETKIIELENQLNELAQKTYQIEEKVHFTFTFTISILLLIFLIKTFKIILDNLKVDKK